MPAKRLSTAFDSVTLYGNDPDAAARHLRQGRQLAASSIATLDDMKVLYSGFDLCSPSTSVSMTINGPAPTILAMFMNTAIDQQLDKFRADNGREPTDDEAAKIRAWVLANVRGTVQADILKEDQGQNTCIFSTEFSLKVMGDIQRVLRAPQRAQLLLGVDLAATTSPRPARTRSRQLAFTLSNGFTFVEAYLARGMHIDDFAPNLSLLLHQRHGPGVHGARPRRAAHLGGGDARHATAPTSAARSSSTTCQTSRPQPARAGDRSSTTSAPRCRR